MSRILISTALVVLLAASPAAGLVGESADVLPTGMPEAVPAIQQEQDELPSNGPGTRPGGEFGWPIPGAPTMARAFEAPTHRYGPGHRGVDLAGRPGTAVLAAGAGTVVFAGQVAGREVISIDHPGGLRTTYEPVAPSVAAGDRVTRGQQIGTLLPGHPGCSAAACLHWGLRRGMDYLDPLLLLGLARVRLLPWAGSSGTG